jgi:hypothetical protein
MVIHKLRLSVEVPTLFTNRFTEFRDYLRLVMVWIRFYLTKMAIAPPHKPPQILTFVGLCLTLDPRFINHFWKK